MHKIKKISYDIFIGWIFSTHGTLIVATISGSLMTFLVSLTPLLKPFAPAVYYLAFLLGLILLMAVIKLANQRSRIETFIEYDILNAEIKIQKTKNICDQRIFNFAEYSIPITSMFITFNAPIYPSSVVEVVALRGSAPKVYKQYVSEKGVVIFLEITNQHSTFRLIFNKNYEA